MTASWSLALACVWAVGLMGFAIQRGGTCTVAAVEEIVNQRRAYRLAAMLEASLWVVGGLALAQLAQWAGSMPRGYSISAWTVVGGVVLGLGAWVNGACVFGAIARLGSGQWAQAFTPLGFFVGCLSAPHLLRRAPFGATTADPAAPWWVSAAWVAPAFVVYALWRVGLPALKGWRGEPAFRRQLAQRVWTPHAATIVIGGTFVVTLLLAGSWAYTDVLAQLAQMTPMVPFMQAQHGQQPLGLPLALFAALYAGAFIGGWTAGRWRPRMPAGGELVRAASGGALMGLGSSLIPGSNDGLIFIGIPLLRPYAWLALCSMVISIAAALSLQRSWVERQAR